jgi:hypothetical protein
VSQKLDDQIATIEKALGERMIDHALVIVRAWLNELGENNPYEQAYEQLRKEYSDLFTQWLTSSDPEHDVLLNKMTGTAYRLVDAAYASLRLHRGLSPDIRGFNPQSPQSVTHYFTFCLRLKEEDYTWFRNVCNDTSQAVFALIAVAALAKNIRECFNERMLMALIEGINAENEVVAEQCMANALIILANYDVRIDFFPELQNAFMDAVSEMGDEGEDAFHTLCALVRSVKYNWRDSIASGELKVEDLPEELQSLLELTGEKESMDGVVSWMPASEQAYMQGLVDMLPDTWVYSALMGDSPERAQQIAIVYLSVGRMDLLWEHTDVAARWLRQQLRDGSESPMDYMNYGHCMLLQGDKMMAFEYYRQARNMCKSPKDFFALYRPDRRALVDHGIPVETVYLLEDQLING